MLVEKIAECQAYTKLGPVQIELTTEGPYYSAAAFLQGQIVGVLKWTITEYELKHGSSIRCLFVNPDFRRKGIATALWEFAKEKHYLRHNGCRPSSEYEWSKTVGGKDIYGKPPEDCWMVIEN